MSSRVEMGRHVHWFEEPDVIGMVLRGKVTRDQGMELTRLQAEWSQGKEWVYLLMDVSELTGIDPEVRREIVASVKDRRCPFRAFVNYRSSVLGRVLSRLALTSVNLQLPASQKVALFYLDGEEAARKVIAEMRANDGRVGIEGVAT
jgi:hypothetical protein